MPSRTTHKLSEIDATAMLATCEGCQDRVPLYRIQPNGTKFTCANRAKAAQRDWNSRNRDKVRESRRIGKYGIGVRRFHAMLAAQNGRCAVCGGEPDKGYDLVIDHDHACCPGVHTCGKCVRGLLCRNCNIALGLLKDSTVRLNAAVLYLYTHQAITSEAVSG